MKVSSSLRQRKRSLMTLQIIYTSKCPGNQNSISQSFTLLKESANMDCSEEPLRTQLMNSKTLQLRKKLLIQKKAFRFKTIEIPYENSNANDERLTMLKKSMTLL